MRAIKFLSSVGLMAGFVVFHHVQTATVADGPTYTGSKPCRMCHSPVAKVWVNSKHASLKPEDADSEGVKYRKSTGFDPATGKSVEAGVACEMCHGPGSAHVKAATAAKKTTIVNGKNLEPVREAMICGQCHTTGKSKTGKDYPEGYKPGDDLTAVFTLEAAAQHSKQSVGNEWAGSKHAAKGTGCTKCHDAHGGTYPHQLLKAPAELCAAECHKDHADIKKHQPDAAADATCVGCHMPQGSHLFTKEAAKKGKEAGGH
jgi:predicted CXXCH cytochrome family protein